MEIVLLSVCSVGLICNILMFVFITKAKQDGVLQVNKVVDEFSSHQIESLVEIKQIINEVKLSLKNQDDFNKVEFEKLLKITVNAEKNLLKNIDENSVSLSKGINLGIESNKSEITRTKDDLDQKMSNSTLDIKKYLTKVILNDENIINYLDKVDINIKSLKSSNEINYLHMVSLLNLEPQAFDPSTKEWVLASKNLKKTFEPGKVKCISDQENATEAKFEYSKDKIICSNYQNNILKTKVIFTLNGAPVEGFTYDEDGSVINKFLYDELGQVKEAIRS